MNNYTLPESNYVLEPIPLHSHEKITDAIARGVGSHWGKPLSESQFLRREKFLEKNSICNPGDFEKKISSSNRTLIKGKYRFILRDLSINDCKTDYEDSQDVHTQIDNIVSSCELIIRDAYRVDESGSIKPCLNGCLGSVYTLENHRKKGYAKVMLNLINSWCAKFVDDEYFFGSLYSEVDEYYNQFGFISRYIPVYRIPHESIFGFSGTTNPESINNIKYNVKLMKNHEFNDLIKVSNDKLKQKFQQLSKDDHKIRYFNKFDYRLVDWLHERSMFYIKELTDYHGLLKFGLTLTDPITNSPFGYIIWQFNFGDKNINILNIESCLENNDNRTPIIIQCLIFEMLKYFTSTEAGDIPGLISKYFGSGIYIWQNYITETISLEKTPQFQHFFFEQLKAEVTVKQFEDSLSAIKLFNMSDNVEFKANNAKDDCNVIWECNYKWAWF